MHSEYELAIKRASIKGIVKPNQLNKDILRLRDPSVRVRSAPRQQDVRRELNKTPILPPIPQQKGPIQNVSPSYGIVRQNETLVLPRIPQPPAQPKPQQTVSRNSRLPNIQQQPSPQQSRIPQPPKGERINRLSTTQFRRITRFQ